MTPLRTAIARKRGEERARPDNVSFVRVCAPGGRVLACHV